ncbi:hypothetical protein BJ742DRAFT_742940 [Cladochytrium replicatum]|nr:hypothetical protein BJ742DRAFT_742940 [Cladochytrium replicatum]
MTLPQAIIMGMVFNLASVAWPVLCHPAVSLHLCTLSSSTAKTPTMETSNLLLSKSAKKRSRIASSMDNVTDTLSQLKTIMTYQAEVQGCMNKSNPSKMLNETGKGEWKNESGEEQELKERQEREERDWLRKIEDNRREQQCQMSGNDVEDRGCTNRTTICV